MFVYAQLRVLLIIESLNHLNFRKQAYLDDRVRLFCRSEQKRNRGELASVPYALVLLHAVFVGLNHLLERVTRTTSEILEIFLRGLPSKYFDLQP